MNYTYPQLEDVLKFTKCGMSIKVSGFKTNFVAKELLKKDTYVYAKIENSDKGFIYMYDNASGVYKLVQEKDILRNIKNFLEHYDSDLVRMSALNEIVDLMVTEMDTIPLDNFDNNPQIINFQNGILDLDTLKLSPHSKDALCTVQMPVEWNGIFVEHPELAQSPIFDKYLNTLTDGYSEKDKNDIKTVLLEVIGVVLSNIPGYKFKKALLVYGKGNTGKTQIRNLAISLVGERNSAVVELADLETREGPSRAYKKRLIGSGDMKFGTAGQIATFKDATGGETLPIRFLYKEAFPAKITGVFWFGANFLPLFGGDKGDWVYERFIPVQCKNVIPEEERDPDLLEKLLTEKDAIVYKAIMAMREAVKRGYRYTIPESSKKDLEVYKSVNNIIVEFFNEHCINLMAGIDYDDAAVKFCDLKSSHSGAVIFNTFRNWAKSNYNTTPTKADFENTIAEILGIPRDKITVRTAEMRAYYGFDIEDNCFQEYYKP